MNIYHCIHEINDNAISAERERELIRKFFRTSNITSFNSSQNADEDIKNADFFVFSSCGGFISAQNCHDIAFAMLNKIPAYYIDGDKIYRTARLNIKVLAGTPSAQYYAEVHPEQTIYVPDIKTGNLWAFPC